MNDLPPLKAVSSDIVLVAGPPVRASSWEPAAEYLRKAGRTVQVPDVLAHHTSLPPWRTWTQHLVAQIDSADEPVIVGHSSASALVAELATRLPARSLIIVDGDIPPAEGSAPPVRPALRDFIRGLANAGGMLPVWSRWFSGDAERAALVGIDRLACDPVALARFEEGLPEMPVGWFDDTIELANWNHVPSGFIQTSAIYDHARAEAERRGWPVARLQGTHLDPTLRPAEIADAILLMSSELDAVNGWRCHVEHEARTN